MSDVVGFIGELRRMLPVDEENVEEFDELLVRMGDSGDPELVGPLLDLFEDGFPLAGVMQLVSGALEVFEPEVYARELVRRLPEMRRRAPFWSEHELKGFLWEEECHGVLVKALMQSDSEVCWVALDVLRGVCEDVPELVGACDKIADAFGVG